MIPASLISLSLVPAIAGTVRLAQLASGAETAQNARFFAQPIPVVLHILVVIPYTMLGAFQFSPGFRRRNRSWHSRGTCTGRLWSGGRADRALDGAVLSMARW